MSYKLIKNGTLIDGTGCNPISNAAVLINGTRIEAVGNYDDIRLPDEKVEVIDAENGFILPGFFDTHVHMLMEIKDLRETINTPFSMKFYEAINYMKKTINTGITSIRDAGFTDVGVKEGS